MRWPPATTSFNAVWLQGRGRGPGRAADGRLAAADLRLPARQPAAHFVSGGSVANLTALAVARQAYDWARRNARRRRLLFRSDPLRHLPGLASPGLRAGAAAQDPKRRERSRLSLPRSCGRAIAERSRGRASRPFCVVATAGTTNTGAVDPLDALADLCLPERRPLAPRRWRLWRAGQADRARRTRALQGLQRVGFAGSGRA